MKKLKMLDAKIKGEWQVLEYSSNIKDIYFVLDMEAIQRNCIKMKTWLRKPTSRNHPIKKITDLGSFRVLSQRQHNNHYIQVIIHKCASKRSLKLLIMKPMINYTVVDSDACFFQEPRDQNINRSPGFKEWTFRMKPLI